MPTVFAIIVYFFLFQFLLLWRPSLYLQALLMQAIIVSQPLLNHTQLAFFSYIAEPHSGHFFSAIWKSLIVYPTNPPGT
jgi:hypothetical protein